MVTFLFFLYSNPSCVIGEELWIDVTNGSFYINLLAQIHRDAQKHEVWGVVTIYWQQIFQERAS